MIGAVEQWLYSRLVADPTLATLVGARIYAYQAPEGAALPLVLFSLQQGRDEHALGPLRTHASLVYQVKGIAQARSFGPPLSDIADRLDALLEGASGWPVVVCMREQPLAYSEAEDGVEYRHLGGLWRIMVTA